MGRGAIGGGSASYAVAWAVHEDHGAIPDGGPKKKPSKHSEDDGPGGLRPVNQS